MLWRQCCPPKNIPASVLSIERAGAAKGAWPEEPQASTYMHSSCLGRQAALQDFTLLKFRTQSVTNLALFLRHAGMTARSGASKMLHAASSIQHQKKCEHTQQGCPHRRGQALSHMARICMALHAAKAKKAAHARSGGSRSAAPFVCVGMVCASACCSAAILAAMADQSMILVRSTM